MPISSHSLNFNLKHKFELHYFHFPCCACRFWRASRKECLITTNFIGQTGTDKDEVLRAKRSLYALLPTPLNNGEILLDTDKKTNSNYYKRNFGVSKGIYYSMNLVFRNFSKRLTIWWTTKRFNCKLKNPASNM